MLAASTGMGRPSMSRHWDSVLYSVTSKCDLKLTTQLVECILENKPKALHKVLKKKNVDVNVFVRFEVDLEKMSPLHFLVLKGNSEMAHILLESKLCSMDLQTPVDEATALHFACQIYDSKAALAIAVDLLRSGADVNITDHWGKTCLIWASERGHNDLVRLLLSKKSQFDHCSAIENPPEQFQLTTTFSSPIWEHLYKDPYYGNTALIQACRFNHLNIVRELISNGCNMNIQNMNKSTAMHAAAGSFCDKPNSIPQTVNTNILCHLVKCGANMNIKDQHGFTPVARALLAMYEIFNTGISISDKVLWISSCIEKVQILIKSGCDVTQTYSFFSSKKTLLSELLSVGKNILGCNSHRLHEEFCQTIEMLMTAGCPVCHNDIELATDLNVPSVVSQILFNFDCPLSLKSICLVFIRNHTKLPLQEHTKFLELPEILQRQLCLE